MARVSLASISLLSVLLAVLRSEVNSKELPKLKRQKREWVIPPKKLKENKNYYDEVIAKIRSDEETRTSIRYSLEGKGGSLDPVNLFIVDSRTGDVRVTRPLDREKIAIYNISGIAKFSNGTKAEADLDLRFIVEDVNDCVPIFSFIANGAVNESSPLATFVMTVTATDDDEPNNPNSKISYSIVAQQPEEMFYISSNTGQIHVKHPTLDRERSDSYTLTVKGTDLDGAANGNTGTATVVVKILDINDNAPSLEFEMYEGSIEENTINVEVMRIKAFDLDLVNTDNWLAVFTIVSGNEAGYFNITTDSKTNEGILTVIKPVDYEELKEMNLKISVSNKAEYHVAMSDTVTKKTYPIKVNVKNLPDGPMFKPRVKSVNVTEGLSTLLYSVITTYPAIDGDTFEIIKNVRYAKGKDPDNWLLINEKTAEIRLNKLPDRESHHLKNGTYYAEILCITNDIPSKTATGTIALMVEDTNDHCPELLQTHHTMCTDHSVIYLTARDDDPVPNSAPFDFRVIPGSTKQALVVERINDTSAILRAHSPWPGSYQVEVKVRDQQGKACAHPQLVTFNVCTCTKEMACLDRSVASIAVFGASGILLLLLGLLLLLLVPLLLLFCTCGGAGIGGIPAGFIDIPFETSPPLSFGNTERKGDDKDVPLLTTPVEMDGPAVTKQSISALGAWQKHNEMYEDGFGAGLEHGLVAGAEGTEYEGLGYEDYLWRQKYRAGSVIKGKAEDIFQGMALSEAFLQQYYSQKVNTAFEKLHPHKDSFLVYSYEGNSSSAGSSVGCCSLLEADDDLEFLNNLGPKFRTLAEICTGSAIELETSAPSPRPTARPSLTQSPASAHTRVTATTAGPHIEVATATGAATAVSAGAVHMTSSTASSLLEEQVLSTGHAATQLVATPSAHHTLVVPSQTYVLQPKPVLIAATPMLQTARYVVEPRPQDALYVLRDASRPAGVLLEEKQVVSGHVGIGGTVGRAETMVLLEPGQVLHGDVAHVTRSHSPTAGSSQRVVVVETQQDGAKRRVNGGLLVTKGSHQEVASQLALESQKVLLESGLGPVLGREDGLETQRLVSVSVRPQGQTASLQSPAGGQTVFVQEKSVSVTQRSVQGNMAG